MIIKDLLTKLIRPFTHSSLWPALGLILIGVGIGLGPDLALAGLKLEPYLGYGFGSIKQTGPQPYGKLADLVGPGVGARVGLSFTEISVGADFYYHKSKLDMNNDVGLDGYDYQVKGSEKGAYLGLDMPALPRLWLGYIMSAKLVEDDKGEDRGTWKGKGFKAGMGISMSSYLGLNLEYKMITFDNWQGQNGTATQDTVKAASKWEIKTLLLSVSLLLL